MKNKPQKTYIVFTLINILLSSIIAIIVEIILVYNVSKLLTAERLSTGQTNLEFMFSPNIFSIVIYFIIGIIVFSISFMILERHNINAYVNSKINIMEDRINELVEKERENEKSKNDLVTNVAHDLRTPLTSILGYLELLKNNAKKEENEQIDKETTKKYIDIAYTKSKRLQSLLEELFSFTKTSYKKENIHLSNLDMISLMDQLVEETYPQFEKKNLICEIETKIDKLNMNADGDLIARLFENLFSNAIKYGVDGKRIIVKIYQENDSFVNIDVINFGKTIPENEISKIFEQFYRTDRARQSSTGGTGLGLAIAKNIAMMHGGDINVTSGINGTNFSVKLSTTLEADKNEKEELNKIVSEDLKNEINDN